MKPLHESVLQTLMSLQFPALLEEISTYSWCQDKRTPQESKQKGPCGRNATTATTVNTTKENAASVSTVWSELSLDEMGYIFVDALSQRQSPNHSLRISTFNAPVWSQEKHCAQPHCCLCLFKIKAWPWR